MRGAWWTCRVRAYKWWHPVFFWIVDSAMINANVLRNAHVEYGGREFWLQVVEGLFESKEQEGACEAGAEAQAFSPRRRQGSELPGGRLQLGHFIGKLKGQRSNCKPCMFDCIRGSKAYTTKKTYFCKQCGDHLHLECFEEYHTKSRPVSGK